MVSERARELLAEEFRRGGFHLKAREVLHSIEPEWHAHVCALRAIDRAIAETEERLIAPTLIEEIVELARAFASTSINPIMARHHTQVADLIESLSARLREAEEENARLTGLQSLRHNLERHAAEQYRGGSAMKISDEAAKAAEAAVSSANIVTVDGYYEIDIAAVERVFKAFEAQIVERCAKVAERVGFDWHDGGQEYANAAKDVAFAIRKEADDAE